MHHSVCTTHANFHLMKHCWEMLKHALLSCAFDCILHISLILVHAVMGTVYSVCNCGGYSTRGCMHMGNKSIKEYQSVGYTKSTETLITRKAVKGGPGTLSSHVQDARDTDPYGPKQMQGRMRLFASCWPHQSFVASCHRA